MDSNGTTAYLERAISRIRFRMCIPGQATTRAFTLVAAAQLVMKGRDCPSYHGAEGEARLVADIEAEFPEPVAATELHRNISWGGFGK